MRRFYIKLFVIFLLGLVGVFIANRQYNNRKQTIVKTIESSSSKNYSPQDHAQELLNAGKAIKCDFEQIYAGMTIAGSVYIDGANARTDLTAPDKNNKIKTSHTIFKDDATYLWYEGEPLGMVIYKPEETEKPEEVSIPVKDSVLTTLVESGEADTSTIECDQWEVDNFMFVIPPKVAFINADEFYDKAEEAVCQKCNEETTEASRLLCRKTLECR